MVLGCLGSPEKLSHQWGPKPECALALYIHTDPVPTLSRGEELLYIIDTLDIRSYR